MLSSGTSVQIRTVSLCLWLLAQQACLIVSLPGENDSDDDDPIENVNAQPPTDLSYEFPKAIYIKNNAITDNAPLVTGTITGYSISQALPAGLSFDTDSGIISGTPTASSINNIYTITAENDAGDTTYDIEIMVSNTGFVVNSNGEGTDFAADGVCETTAGNGICTLRAAIQETNSMAGRQTILIPQNVTITLTSNMVNLTDDVHIAGESQTTSIISGASTYRLFNSGTNGLTISLTRLNLRETTRAADGAALRMVGGTLTVRECTFLNNSATGTTSSGGAIWVSDSFNTIPTNVAIYDSLFQGNSASDNAAEGGGAISADATSLVIDGTSFKSNLQTHAAGAGGAVIIFGGNNSISNSLFLANDSSFSSGAIIIFDGSTDFSNVTFSGNTSVDNGAAVSLINNSTSTFTNCTFYGNETSAGANPIGGILINGPGTSTIVNTIFEGNLNAGSVSDCAAGGGGAFTSLGSNLTDTDGTNCPLLDPTDIIRSSAGLMGLADNGGETHTHAIDNLSSAYDAGADASCPDTDARGIARPQGISCDIGAFELE